MLMCDCSSISPKTLPMAWHAHVITSILHVDISTFHDVQQQLWLLQRLAGIPDQATVHVAHSHAV